MYGNVTPVISERIVRAVSTTSSTETAPRRGDRTHYLYIAVLIAVLLGIVVGFAFPGFGKSLKPLGDGFVNLVKMMISPIIFCTLVLGIGRVAKAATVGKVGALAIGYFLIMSTVALIIGLLVGNVLNPGTSRARRRPPRPRTPPSSC
jgi:aerobic C4-dicarboxylate transport protein